MSHKCHARECTTSVRPQLLMCALHWRSVPRNIQAGVLRHYRDGQCDDKRPSLEWHEAASAAIGFVARLEGFKSSVAESMALREYGHADQKMLEELKTLGR